MLNRFSYGIAITTTFNYTFLFIKTLSSTAYVPGSENFGGFLITARTITFLQNVITFLLVVLETSGN